MAGKKVAVTYLAVSEDHTHDYGVTAEQAKDGKARPRVRKRTVWPTIATCQNAGYMTRLTPTGIKSNLFNALLKAVHHENDGKDALVPTNVLNARGDTRYATEPCDGCCGWPKDDPRLMDGPTRDKAYADADDKARGVKKRKPAKKAAKKKAPKKKAKKKQPKKPTKGKAKKKAKRGRR